MDPADLGQNRSARFKKKLLKSKKGDFLSHFHQKVRFPSLKWNIFAEFKNGDNAEYVLSMFLSMSEHEIMMLQV